jgi:hypothetical protein
MAMPHRASARALEYETLLQHLTHLTPIYRKMPQTRAGDLVLPELNLFASRSAPHNSLNTERSSVATKGLQRNQFGLSGTTRRTNGKEIAPATFNSHLIVTFLSDSDHSGFKRELRRWSSPYLNRT